MISWNSIKTFITLNSFMMAASLGHFIFTKPSGHFTTDLLNQFAFSLIKNYLIIDFIEYRTSNKNKIMNKQRNLIQNIPKERFYKEFDMFVASTTLVDSYTQVIIKKNFIKDFVSINYYDLVEFIFISFAFEIIFDFFHYWMHLYLHKNPFLYKNFHKIHHKWAYPMSILTFYNHPFDFFFTNSIPTFLTLYIFPFDITYFQYELMHSYKTLLEIGGHSGKILNSNSFTQCIWLPKLFNFHLKVEDHDLHHSLNNCNYAKRFTLWDKVFGTFLEKKEIS
jgi:sterol desaturase/sphingolipid hydroxylase (fatty acid hydroxylase superfamily)